MSVTILRKVNVSGGTVLRAANNLGDVGSAASARGNLGVQSLVDALQQFASRVGADYLQSDGAVTNRIEMQPGAAGALAASGLTLVDGIVDVPTSNPSASAYLLVMSSTSVADFNATLNAGFIRCTTAGELQVKQIGPGATTDWRTFGYAGWRAAYSGRRVRLTIALSGDSTTAPVVWQDGVDISALFSAATNGTPPNWMPTTLVNIYTHLGFGWPSGYYRPGAVVNRRYTQADVDFVQTTGRLPASDARGGSAVAAYTSDFGAGVDLWADIAGGTTVAGNIDSYAGQNDWLRATRTSTTGSLAVTRPSTPIVGQRYRVTGTLARNANSVAAFAVVRLSSSAVGQILVALPAADTAVPFSGEILADSTNITIALANGSGVVVSDSLSGGAMYVRGITLTPLGAIAQPVIQPGTTLTDSGPNRIPATLTGFTPVTQRNVGTTTNDNAPVGVVGEFVTATRAFGSATALTNATGLNVTSITLTPGDWDVTGSVGFVPQATTVRQRSIASISTVSATPAGTPMEGTVAYNTADASAYVYSVAAVPTRISVATATTVYLVAYANFASGTQSAFGVIQARRVR